MAGFGLCPFGGVSGTVFGVGSPGAAATAPTGNTTAIRYINPSTKDYEVDATTGHLRQTSGTMQAVMLALTTTLGSATAAVDFGINMPRRMGTRFTSEVTAAVRRALRHLTHTQKRIAIERIEVTRGSGRFAVDLRYRNLETGQTEAVEYPQ